MLPSKRILDRAATVALATAVAVFALWLALPLAGIKPLIVLSGSMEPELRLGGVVFVKETEAASVHVGDILTFAQPGTTKAPLVTHRVVRIETSDEGRPQFITRGDANSAADPWVVKAEAIRGVGVFDLPYIGYAAEFAGSSLGFAILLAAPAMLLAALEIWGISRQRNSQPKTDPAGSAP